MKTIKSSLSIQQADDIITNLSNLPRKLTVKMKIKRILWDLSGLLVMLFIIYSIPAFPDSFFVFSPMAIICMIYVMYIHTNEKKNNGLNLLVGEMAMHRYMDYQIDIQDDKIIISHKRTSYDVLVRVFHWNHLIVVVVEDQKKGKSFVFLDLKKEEEEEFINKAKEIYKLSIEYVDQHVNLRTYVKGIETTKGSS